MSTELTTAGPRWRRVLRRSLGAFVAVAVFALLARLGLGYLAARQLQAELAIIRAAGQPLTLKELRPALAIDDTDDGWPFYEAALALVRQEGLTEVWTASRAELRAAAPTATQPDGGLVAGTERVLGANALALDLLRRGAERATCRADIGIEQGWPFFGERLKRARAAVRLLSLQTCVCISRGDGNGAVEVIVCSLRLLRMFDQQPIPHAYLLRAAAMQRAAKDTQFVLQRCALEDAALARLQEALREADMGMPPLERMVLAERVYAIESMQELIAGGLDPWADPVWAESTSVPLTWPTAGWWTRPWGQWRAIGHLRGMAEFVKLARKPWAEVIQATQALERGEPPVDQILGPSLAQALRHAARAVALVRSAAVAVMIERHRRANGVLPSSLADLTPTYGDSVPRDPFNGEDLRYRAEAGCYVVYSIGADGVDNQGAVVAQKEGEDPRDVGLRVHFEATP